MREIIIPGKTEKCADCGQENGMFVKISEIQEAFLSGSYCAHGGISIGFHKINRQKAIEFIEEEMTGATDLEFIGQARQALALLMSVKYQKKTA